MVNITFLCEQANSGHCHEHSSSRLFPAGHEELQKSWSFQRHKGQRQRGYLQGGAKHNRDMSEVVVSSSKGEATQSFHVLFSRSAKAGLFKNAVEEAVAGVTVTGQYDLTLASSILFRLRELSLLYAEGNK